MLALLWALALPVYGVPAPAEQRRIEAKIQSLRAALKADPDNPELVYQLARQLSLLERTADAAKQYARIVAVYPDNADYLLGQGQNFLWGGQAQRAIAPLRRAMRVAPAYQDVQRTLAQALTAAGRSAEARNLYTRALQRFGQPAWARQGIAALDAATTTTTTAAAPRFDAASAATMPAAAPATPESTSAVATRPTAELALTPAAAAAPVIAQAQAVSDAPVAAAAAAQPLAQASAAPQLLRRSLETGFVRETLSNGTPDWRDTYVQFNQIHEDRRNWLARITSASRFGLADSALLVAGFAPLTEKTAINLEAMVSPTNRVLARHTLHAQLRHALPAGWGVQAGWKHLAYNTASIDALDLTVERYFGPFRAAWTITPSRSSTAGDAVGQRLQAGYFYGDTSSVQLLVAAGREVDKPVAATGAIVATDVRSVALFGHHAFDSQWGLVYGAGRTQQGTTTREALSFGLRWRF